MGSAVKAMCMLAAFIVFLFVYVVIIFSDIIVSVILWYRGNVGNATEESSSSNLLLNKQGRAASKTLLQQSHLDS